MKNSSDAYFPAILFSSSSRNITKQSSKRAKNREMSCMVEFEGDWRREQSFQFPLFVSFVECLLKRRLTTMLLFFSSNSTNRSSTTTVIVLHNSPSSISQGFCVCATCCRYSEFSQQNMFNAFGVSFFWVNLNKWDSSLWFVWARE